MQKKFFSHLFCVKCINHLQDKKACKMRTHFENVQNIWQMSKQNEYLHKPWRYNI